MGRWDPAHLVTDGVTNCVVHYPELVRGGATGCPATNYAGIKGLVVGWLTPLNAVTVEPARR